MTYQDL